MSTADRHKYKPIRFRPPEADRLWLMERHEKTGRAVNAILADALAEHRARIEKAAHDTPETA